ncbi:endonuclease/exonuclease/phosphatase family protein [Ruegeria lacuscaerulensis]|uniref:endonuclease/exonuclease/phosphatase family protein n=1 Tax=Ruegeria lacuscaerulensis TaxID=55218 RepID=UPI0014811C36|nr:endonuclease/exonuclease/phosphatase family protein [Ruegeria lacuscaerulensis]
MYATRLICVTWNIHRARGHDGLVDPSRIHGAVASDLAPLAPDIFALQEADEECRPHAGLLDMNRISAETGLTYQHDAPGMRWGRDSDGFLGTILFLHPRFNVRHRDVLDLPGHCYRGAVVIEAVCDGISVRVISTHLSLFQPLRVIQMRIVGQYLRRRPEMQNILLGDLNEWRPWGGAMFQHRLIGRSLSGPVRATFPAKRPLLPLDRILTDREGAVRDMQVCTSRALRSASDHLPLKAEVLIEKSGE